MLISVVLDIVLALVVVVDSDLHEVEAMAVAISFPVLSWWTSQ